MELEPSSGYQAAETMNTKKLEFSQESLKEGKTLIPGAMGAGMSPNKRFHRFLNC